MAKVIWTEQAVDDLSNIADYCSHFSENYASSIVTKLFNKTNILKSMPEAGRIVPEKNNTSIRELIEGTIELSTN
jgi:toxin ParE1/3/4